MARRLIHSEAVCLDCPSAYGFEEDRTTEEAQRWAENHEDAQGHRNVVVYEGIGHLKDELKDAKIVSHDRKTHLTFAWFGGHQVHVYRPNGDEEDVITAGDSERDEASREDVWRTISRYELPPPIDEASLRRE